MTTLAELMAAVVVHSSAAAYSHFGVTLEPVQVEHNVIVEKTVARSPRPALKVTDCPRPPVLLRSKNVKA